MLNSTQTGVSSSSSNTPSEGERRNLNSELWHACAGPLVSLPTIGSRVVYLPQGHSEQVAASTQREADAHIPNYPNLPPQLICRLHDVILHADMETDEVYCQMTLQPVTMQDKEPFLVPDIGLQSRQPNIFFCKTLTASDTSTHGGFSIPRRAAEKVFPVLDFTQQPPAQELMAKDLHDAEWKFRHIFRGQPKRHLLTTGWSVFVSSKRLSAGDQVLFIRNEKGQLLLGIRRANRPQTALPSSVLSSDSMHIGVLAAAALAASTSSHFTVFYNPRASPSEFVIPYSKFEKAVYHTRVSIGMRFRMLFETEESSVRRYMGTITDISDVDPVRWANSKWRSIKVGWDESTAGERQRRVSLWEIEPLTTFLLYPPTSNWRLKNPWTQSFSSSFSSEMELESLKNTSGWSQFQHENNGFYGVPAVQGAGLHPSLGSVHMAGVSDFHDALGAEALIGTFPSKQLHVRPKPMQTPDQSIHRIQLHPQEPTPMLGFPQPVATFQSPTIPFQHYKQSSENALGQHGPLLQQETPQQPPSQQLKSSGLHQQQPVQGSMNQQQTLYPSPSQQLKRSAPQQPDASPERLPRQQPYKLGNALEHQHQQLQHASQETQQQQQQQQQHQLQHITHEAQQQVPQSHFFQQQQSPIQPLKHSGALQQQPHGHQLVSHQQPPSQHQQMPIQPQLKHSAALQQQLYGPQAVTHHQQMPIQQQLKHNGALQQQPHGSQSASHQQLPIQHQPKHNVALQQLQLPTLLPQQPPIQQQLKHNGALQQQHQQGPTLQQQMQMQQQLSAQQPLKQNTLLQQVHHASSSKQQTTQLEAPAQQLKPSSPLLQQHGQQLQLLQHEARFPAFHQSQNHSFLLEQLHQHQGSLLPDFSSANCHITAPQPHSTLNSSEPMSLLESSNVLSSTSYYPFQLPTSMPQWAGSEPSTVFNSLPTSHNSFVLQPMLGNVNMDSDNHLVHQSAAMMQGGELHQDSKIFSWSAAPRQPAITLQSDLTDISGHSYATAQTDAGVLPSFPSPGALSSTSFNFKDCDHQEQEDLHSDLHRQMLFGVNIDASSVVMSASLSDGSRANNDDFQSQCMSQLMAGQSSETGAEFPFSCDLVNGDFDDLHFLQPVQAFSHVNQPVRTYTKVYKSGSVGRSLDVTRFNNYDELRSELARLFGLGGQLEDPRSGWQLVFVDKENDWLLLGDDPWEVFITNVRSIRIQSPTDVSQMQGGIGLQTSFPVQLQQTSSSSEDVTIQQDSRNPASVITSTCSFDY